MLFFSLVCDGIIARMAKYPIFLEMSGRKAVVIGGGAVAARKVAPLVDAGARVVVVAEAIAPTLQDAFALPRVEVILSPYRKEYLAGAILAIAATSDPQVNKQIYADCQQLEVLCNVVDEPSLCDFFVPAVVKRGDLQIAVCTEGHCPAYAGHLRRKLEELFTDDHGQFVKALEQARQDAIAIIADADIRKAVIGHLAGDESFERFLRYGSSRWQDDARKLIQQAAQGKIAF